MERETRTGERKAIGNQEMVHKIVQISFKKKKKVKG